MDWEYKVHESKIEKKPQKLDLEVSESDRELVAKRLGVVSVDRLHVMFDVSRPEGGYIIKVKGRLEADVVQECVVSCQPVVDHLEEEFEAFYADRERAVLLSCKRREQDLKNGAAEIEILREEEDPEPIVNGQIDLADLAMQYLSLGLDSYPKAEGVVYDGPSDDEAREEPAESRKNPFEALRQLKDL